MPYSERQLVGLFAAVDEHRLQVVEVEEEQAFLVGDVEGDVEHAFLNVVEVHQPAEQQRSHLADGGADRMALLAEQVPELDRRVVIRPVGHADVGGALGEDRVDLRRRRAGHGKARKVALHVGDEARHARRGQSLDDTLQCDRLAGAGRARDQPVAVGPLELKLLRIGAARRTSDENAARRFTSHAHSPRRFGGAT